MDKLDNRTYTIITRLQNARLSLLAKQPFYALLLLHMKFALDLTCETAYTDGIRIAFNPDFITDLSDSELEFVLMHEVLHAALGHPFRRQADYDQECYDKACDIVVNSNILYSFGGDVRKITLKKYGEAMHLTPTGKEGYEHTVEEVYVALLKAAGKKPPSSSRGKGGKGGKSGKDGTSCKGGKSDKGGTSGKGGKGGKNTGASATDNQKDAAPPAPDENGDVSEAALQGMIASLLKGRAVHGKIDPNAPLPDANDCDPEREGTVDDHSFWQGGDEDGADRDVWLQRMVESTDIVTAQHGSLGCGSVPVAAQIIVNELTKPSLDWRTILNDFVQEEICDYSFSPPDRRMQDSPFFLPDFNEKEDSVQDILFMIDTSGSMSPSDVTACYSEIYGAIQQFNGKLQGKLGFFDAVVVEPIPFEDEDEFKIIRPKGGGGTSFEIIFDYVQREMQDNPPVSIIILTDGFAPFPDEAAAGGIPVLWIINNNAVDPPWGKVARLLN